MVSRHYILGFRIEQYTHFWYRGKKYRLGIGGFRAIELLATIVASRPKTPQVTWLLTFRQQLAEMDLDWDLPTYPVITEPQSVGPLRLEVDLGDLAERED